MNVSVQKPEWNFNTFAWADEQKLPGFGKLLESWLQVHKNYCNGCRSENSWEDDFKERSQIGFLSNAAVLISGIALEEWSVSKKSGNGRNDVFLRFQRPNPVQDYLIEAKWGAIDVDVLQSESDWEKQLSGIMGNAFKDAAQLNDPNLFKETFPAKAVAVSFFAIKVKTSLRLTLHSKTFRIEKMCGLTRWLQFVLAQKIF